MVAMNRKWHEGLTWEVCSRKVVKEGAGVDDVLAVGRGVTGARSAFLFVHFTHSFDLARALRFLLSLWNKEW